MKKLVSMLTAFLLVLGFANVGYADDDKNCDDFSTQEEAQQYFDNHDLMLIQVILTVTMMVKPVILYQALVRTQIQIHQMIPKKPCQTMITLHLMKT